MDNIYNAIQNVYNMDKTTWQEVLAELYNLVANVENKFDLFELKFGSLLGEQVTRELKKMYDDGSLASLINDVLLQDINEKVDTFKTEVSSQLDIITKNKYDDVIISGNELSMKANGVVKKIIQLPSAGGTVEGHTHSNKLILDNITNNKVNNWDSAYEHSQSSHFDTTTIFNELNTTNKTIIGAINELFALIKNNGSGSENTITSGIKANPSNVNVNVNSTADITMLFGNDVTNKSLDFMSGNGAIASVSDLGSYKYRITGVGQGNTTIRFRTSDGKFETSCSVTVTSSNVEGNSPTPSNEYTQSCTSEYILDKMYPMGQSHEAIPSGLITDNWKYNTRWENQNRPTAVAHNCGQSGCPGTGLFRALGCWSSIYRVEGTPFTQNTGVEMKDIKVYGWYNGQWELVQHLPIPNGNFYPESFGGDVNMNFADSVKQTSTSKTIILREKNKIQAMNWNTGQLQTENCMYHPFSDVKNFDTKYEYIYTCIDLRKVKWNENGVDDRDQTHYCSNCGGDWWLAEGLTFHDSWQHNKGICQPKMIEITNEWKRFSMTTVPQNWEYGFPK